MLPDLPQIKQKLDALLILRMKAVQSSKFGPFSAVKPTIMHEGATMLLQRADGSRETVRFELASAKIVMSTRESEELPPDELLKKIDSAAEELAGQISRTFYRRFEEVTAEVGNVVSMQGEPLSVEHLFQMMEKIQLDFDESGRPLFPTVVAGSREGYERMVAINEQIAGESVLQEKFKALIDTKREEFREREADRKLVG